MSAGFIFGAAWLWVLALSFLVPGLLLRRPGASPPSSSSADQPAWRVFLALAVLVGAGAASLYGLVGNPRAPDGGIAAPVSAADPPDLERATEQLRQRLVGEPGNREGWVLLARTYKTMQRFEASRDAYQKAYALDPSDVDVQVEYAEALALSSPTRALEGEPRALLQRALAQSPQHQRGLWLMGISEMQANRYADAIAYWQRLVDGLPPDSEIAGSVREQIEAARKQLPAGVAGTDTDPSAAVLTVSVDVAPALRPQLTGTEVLYVFARLPSGPRAPLAVARVPAAHYPLQVVLRDDMGMLPGQTLSQASEVVVEARISKTGSATPTSGDWQAAPVTVNLRQPSARVALQIERALP